MTAERDLAPAVFAKATVWKVNDQGEPRLKTPQELVVQYGETAQRVVADLNAQRSRYEMRGRTMVEAPESVAAAANRTIHRAIGTMGEKSLHAELKEWYSRPGDRLEVQVDGYLVDIRRGRRLIEIQTGNFSAMKRKLAELIRRRRLSLVYPVAVDKWLVRVAADGRTSLGRRKSPKHGSVYDLFGELVSVPEMVAEPNFSVEVLLIQVEEVRRDDGRGSRDSL